jgi:curli biogenesis system outer membrane secretion channel CsgG
VAAPVPDVGRIETESIRADGRGKIAAEAVDEAIKSAILQVNGTTVDLSSEQFKAAIAVAVGQDDIGLRSAGFAELVSEHSRGAVTNFKIVSLAKSDAEQLYIATIEANVAKFRPPEDSQKIKVVIAPVRVQSASYQVGNDVIPAAQVADQLHQQVVNELTQTGRFSVLDREFTGDVANELDLVSSGQAPTSEFAKLGQALSADLIWVGQIESLGYQRHAQNLATSDRQLVSYSGGATLSHRLINVATRQIVFSDSVSAVVPAMGPTTLGLAVNTQEKLGELEGGLASQVVPEIVMRMFPVTVVSRNGNAVVLSQGGKILREHLSYQIVLMGDEVKDPQTGQSLGRMEQPCCVVDIDHVAPTMSYGTLRNVSVNLDQAAPGGMQLRQIVAQQTAAASTASNPVSTDEPASGPSQRKPSKVKATQDRNKPNPNQAKDDNW